MLKKYLGVALALLAVSVVSKPATADDVTFKEGVHYVVLPVQKSPTPQITKFFSFFCGACYNIEPVMQWLEPQLPDVPVQKIHVNFVRGASPETMALLSRGSLLSKQLGKNAEFHNAVFRQIHVARTPFKSQEDVQLPFLTMGFDKDRIEAGFKSFALSNQYQAGEKKLAEYTDRRFIEGVPTLIVNDKYRIVHSALDRKNFEQQLLALTKHLLTL